MSLAKDISIAIATKLSDITVANGYNTDIGLSVYRGRRRVELANLPCCVIIEGEEEVVDQIRTMTAQGYSQRNVTGKLNQTYTIEAILECDPDDPNDAAHDAIADIKVALYKGDLSLNGKVTAISYRGRVISAREEGFNAISGAVIIGLDFVENLNSP